MLARREAERKARDDEIAERKRLDEEKAVLARASAMARIRKLAKEKKSAEAYL